MATATLVGQEIQEGQRLIDALNLANFLVDSALWIYSSERETWRLMLASPFYDRQGPLKTYHEIISVFRNLKPELGINWMDLVAVSPKHELIKGLSQLQQDSQFNLSGKRLRNNTINHIYVDDAYIYPIK